MLVWQTQSCSGETSRAGTGQYSLRDHCLASTVLAEEQVPQVLDVLYLEEVLFYGCEREAVAVLCLSIW